MTTLDRPVVLGGAIGAPHRRIDDEFRFPVSVGLAVFLSSIGSNIPLGSFGWYIRCGLLPLLVLAAWATGKTIRSMQSIWISPSLMVVCGWMVIAAAWSPLPFPLNYQFALLFPVMALTAHIGAAVFQPAGLLRMLTAFIVVTLVAVAVHTAVAPGAAFSLYQNNENRGFGGSLGLRSFFYHKNSLGIFLAFAAAFHPMVRSRTRRMAFAGLIGVLLVLCNSSTAWVTVACIVAGRVLISRAAQARRSGSRGGTFLLVSAALVAAGSAIAGRGIIFELLGRERNLTGRDVLWRYALEASLERPWLGYGPGGVWERLDGPAYPIRRAAGFDVPSSHQGVIDLMLDYGIVGAVLFGIAFVGTLILLTRRILAGDDGPISTVSFALVIAVFIGSLTESNLAAPGLQVIALVSGLLWNSAPEIGQQHRADTMSGTTMGESLSRT